MEPFLVSSSVGRQRVSEPKEKSRIQDIVETLCPRLYEGKVILQEIIWSLTPGRYWKEMTEALAEQAVEVASNISHLLEGAEETRQLLDNISQLEQTLHDIFGFVQSETQQNPLLSTKDLCVGYLSLDRQLRGLLKPFEQTAKKPLVLRGISTIQEDHACVAPQQDDAVAEIVPPNNSSAIDASGSFFHNANNIVVRDGAFYAAHNLVIKKFQDYDQTSQGIVEGADVYTPGDVSPKQDIYKGRGYRIYAAYSTAKARAVKIKLYEGSRAKDRCLAAATFSQKVMHPNVLHLIGVSPLNSELPFLVFDESTEWTIESIIASALSKDLKQSLLLGLQTVAGISSGLDYLHTLLYPFASVGLDHFVVSYSHGNIVISFDPEVLADETREQDQPSGESDGGNELYIFHGLCQKTFDAASKAHYEFRKVQRSDLDEFDVDHDLDQDRFEEIEADTGTLDTKGYISDVLSASSMPSTSSRRPSQKSNPSAHRRELVWRSQKKETVSLEEIALRFQRFLRTFSTELGFNRRRGRYTTKTTHRCPGYNRFEITLTPDIAQSAIVSHLTPIPHEICPVCKEIVKDAEIFACICGRDDNESIPTVRCSTCSEWHHRPCVSISENQSFVCQRCKLKPDKSHLPLSQQEVKREEKARRKEEEIWRMEEEVKRKEDTARKAVEAKKMEEVVLVPDAKGKEQDEGQLEQDTEEIIQIQSETQKVADDLKKMEEEARKDIEMRKREDILRQREHELMLRLADNFRKEEEAKKKLEEVASGREESKERVRKDEEARRREEEAVMEKARQMVMNIGKEEKRKREEARLKFERHEARKKAAEAKREEDNMKRKLEAEEKRKAEESARRREEDSRRREEARLEEFRREQEEIQNGSQHPPAWGSSIKPTATSMPVAHRVQTLAPLFAPKPRRLSLAPSPPKIMRSTSEGKAEAPPLNVESSFPSRRRNTTTTSTHPSPPPPQQSYPKNGPQDDAPDIPTRSHTPSLRTPSIRSYTPAPPIHALPRFSTPAPTSMVHRLQTPAPLVPLKPQRPSPFQIRRSISEEKAEAHERWIPPVSQEGESENIKPSKLKSSGPATRTTSYSIFSRKRDY